MNRKILCVLLAIAAVSCNTPKQLSYLLDMDVDVPYGAPQPPEIRISPEDQLGIRVLSEDEKLAAPFNTVEGLADAQAASRNVQYLVDRDGFIEFPVLGRLRVEGKTLKETEVLIADKIREQGFIREPVVLVSLDNFRVTVIGSVSNNVLTVTDPSINLFQLIARSSGTNANVNIKDVMVIRTQDNVQMAYSVNLQSKDVFSSPVFYLKQNDVVYFKPRGKGLSMEGQTALTFIGSGLTLASIITNFIIWTRYR